MLTVGMIGLGAMGEHMARNLAKAGFLSALYNRTTQKAEKLGQELNVTVAHTPQALASKLIYIILMGILISRVCMKKEGIWKKLLNTGERELNLGILMILGPVRQGCILKS